MDVGTMTTPPVNRSALRTAGRMLGLLAIAALAYEALRFYLRDPLHYIVDYSEASFGPYWPRRVPLLLHITGGTLALFAGPFQLWSGLRRRHLAVHRTLGLAYVSGVLLGGGASFYLALYTQPADFGVSLAGLATAWYATVGMAFLSIKQRQIDAHREWMIRSYVATFAFVAFRWLVDLPVWQPLGNAKFATVGWFCWSIPLLATEVALQWRRAWAPARPARAR